MRHVPRQSSTGGSGSPLLGGLPDHNIVGLGQEGLGEGGGVRRQVIWSFCRPSNCKISEDEELPNSTTGEVWSSMVSFEISAWSWVAFSLALDCKISSSSCEGGSSSPETVLPQRQFFPWTVLPQKVHRWKNEFSGYELSGEELSRGRTVWGRIVSGEELSLGKNCPGKNFLGKNCPGKNWLGKNCTVINASYTEKIRITW